jgi:CMP-N,N'-diacetyllegionaminic acid synthase
MIKERKVVGLIPARIGSQRVKAKNLRLIAGKPMMAYAIEALKKARSFDDIYVNSESNIVGEVAREYGIKFYQRPEHLATSASMIDDYIYDFICHIDCDVLAVINPTSPFITAKEIDGCINQFLNSDCDTQLACEDIRTHCFLDTKPINFKTNGQHPRSQDLEPVKALNFAVTTWAAKAFKKQYEERGHAVYTGKIGFYAFEGLSNIDVDWEEDFLLAEVIMENLDRLKGKKAEYHPALKKLLASGKNIKT